MDRRVTPLKRVASPSCGFPPPHKQALGAFSQARSSAPPKIPLMNLLFIYSSLHSSMRVEQ